MSYTIQYNPFTGVPTSVLTDSGASISIDLGNSAFRTFLEWNAQQPVPLDYTTPIAPTMRVARAWRAILNDLQALSSAQRANIKADLTSGSPAKWKSMTDDPTVWAILGNAAAATTDQLVAAVVQLILTNPKYLVQPTFDPTINVPGDQVSNG